MIRYNYSFFLYLIYLGALAIESENNRLKEVFEEDYAVFKNVVSPETISQYKSKFLHEELEYFVKMDGHDFLKDGVVKLFRSGFFDEANLKRWIIW